MQTVELNPRIRDGSARPGRTLLAGAPGTTKGELETDPDRRMWAQGWDLMQAAEM